MSMQRVGLEPKVSCIPCINGNNNICTKILLNKFIKFSYKLCCIVREPLHRLFYERGFSISLYLGSKLIKEFSAELGCARDR